MSEKFGKINSPGDCLLASEYSRLMTMLKLTVITAPDKCSYLDTVNSQITTGDQWSPLRKYNKQCLTQPITIFLQQIKKDYTL